MEMGDYETLGILEEIEGLVSDQLQVVSYKWLSRNYLVSSDTAKKLLQEFVDKQGSESGFEVVYTMSGWLKNDSSAYHISLVPGTKLSDAKQEFDGNCSVQVYSVQACIPKDSALLWNAEFVQAEELFKQPADVDNCLRDNRFCGISNSFVKRSAEGTPASNTALQPKVPGLLGSTKSNSPQIQQQKVQESSPNIGFQSRNIATAINKENNGIQATHQTIKPPAIKEKVPVGPTNKKKGQADKNSTAAGASLANMWGRACTASKPKPSSPPAETTKLVADPIEAQIYAREVVESGISDDDGEEVNFKRVASNDGTRKRRAIFYDSDEDDTEDVISLASPDPPKEQSCFDVKHSTETLAPIIRNLKSDLKQDEDKPKIQDESTTEDVSKPSLMEKSSYLKGKNNEVPFADSLQICGPARLDVEKKDKVTTDSQPNLPKRRKVLKTRINDRGREVSEVVWEGEETETKKAETNETKKTDVNPAKKAEYTAVANAVNRAPTTKKSPAMGSSVQSNAGSKGGKKATTKDPKQGNIMSFFKKV